MTDITTIIEIIIGAAVAIAAAVLILRVISKLDAEKLAKLRALLEIAYDAAKDAERLGLIDIDGMHDYILQYLEQHGVSINSKKIRAFIEATAAELFDEDDDKNNI